MTIRLPRTLEEARQWPGAKPFGILLALLLALVYPGVVVGTHTFFWRDYGVIAYPFIHHTQASFWRGELPLWNPLSNCGAPFLAQWGTMVLYPFSLFYLILPLPWSLGWFCLAHLWLGGMGMYLLAWRWTDHRFAAALAGLTFVFNGVTLSCLEWPNYMVALGWMPWLVRWVEQSWREGGRVIFYAIAAATFQLLVGVPELVVLTWITIGILAIVEIGQRVSPCWAVVKRTFWIVAASAGLVAVQLLPFLELVAHSQRSLNFATTKWAMPAWGWGNLLVPLFHNYKNFQLRYMQNGQEFLPSDYLGIGLLVLAVAAVLHVRRARVWVLAGLTLWSLLMALGDHGYLYPAIRQLMPVMGLARYPIKFVILTAFTVPLLAAFMIPRLNDAALSWRHPAWRSVGFAGLFLAVAMGFVVWCAARYPLPYDQWPATWRNALARAAFLALVSITLGLWGATVKPRDRWLGQAVLLALLLLDVFTHTSRQNPVISSRALVPGLTRLDPVPRWGESRVMISREGEQRLLMSRMPDFLNDFLGKRLALWSNLNVVEGAPKVNGSSTLQVAEQAEVQKLLYDTNTIEAPNLMDFLAVSHRTATNSVIDWTRRPTAMPLLTAGQAPLFLDRTNTLKTLFHPNFNPRRTVCLPLEAKSSIAANRQTNVLIEASRFTAHRVEANVSCATPALLVVSQSHYPAWRAYVDGRETQLWRANHAFQALEVPAGKHQVVIAYQDRTFHIGASVSGLTLIGCVFCYRRARSRRALQQV